MKLDNTMLKTFQSCPLKYKTRMVDHWTGRWKSGALIFGAAVHEGLKAWYQGDLDGLSLSSRVEAAVSAIGEFPGWDGAPSDDYRTKIRAQTLMIEYMRSYPSETFKVLKVEVPFLFGIGRKITWCPSCRFDNDPYAGGFPRILCSGCGEELEEIEYGGIFDALTQFGPGSQSVLYVLEHKTTSQLGAQYFHQFYIDNQPTGYVWGASQVSGKLVGGANINAMCLTSGGKMTFAREMVSRTPSDLERWKSDIAASANLIARAQRLGHWLMHTENCMGKYGKCEFFSVHQLSNPEEQRRRLETDYIKSEWDFERRDEPAAPSAAS